MAARLYATGAVPTKADAARIAGVHPQYFTALTNENEHVRRLVDEIQGMIDDKAVDESVILRKMSRQALGRIYELMHSSNERVSLDAAKDLADRGPATSKTQKLEVSSLRIGSEDVQQLIKAMVESSKPSPLFEVVTKEGLVEVRDNSHGLPGGQDEPQ
jgi:hypothetical protein